MTRIRRSEIKDLNSGQKKQELELRWLELVLLVISSLAIAAGLWLVYAAKSNKPIPFQNIDKLIAEKQLVNLNKISNSTELLPILNRFESTDDKQFVAEKVYSCIKDNNSSLANVGTLNKLRVSEEEILKNPKLIFFNEKLKILSEKADSSNETKSIAKSTKISTPLFTNFNNIKPFFIVRTPDEFYKSFRFWVICYFLIFYTIYFFWVFRKFKGEQTLLPTIHALSGLGLIMIVSIRDPLRDQLDFEKFVSGVVVGGLLMAFSSSLDWKKISTRFSYVSSHSSAIPLILAIILSLLLILFGKGPGTSDAKVELFIFQPAEFIKILVVFFLASYFSGVWRKLRDLKDPLSGSGKINIPRLDYLLPVALAMAVMLLFFFLQRDLGPALIMSIAFLAMYGVARQRIFLAVFGILIIVTGFLVGYYFSYPITLSTRVQMMISPWTNMLKNGDQLAQSLWTIASGGVTGQGFGQSSVLGNIPAINTDLIISAIGEDLGFIGILLVFILYSFLIYKSIKVALKSQDNYLFFLAFGLSLIVAFEILLISAGILGAFPLSGVVSPFLSYGRSSMFANFIIFGILLYISSLRRQDGESTKDFSAPISIVSGAMGIILLLILLRLTYVQILKSDEIIIEGVLTTQADGQIRYVYNPRITEVTRLLPRGTIYDRNGIPLATSNLEELEKHHQEYKNLGINLEEITSKLKSRYYPFGNKLFYLLGDLPTKKNWGASNTSYIEKDYKERIQGYAAPAKEEIFKNPKTSKEFKVYKIDYGELIPLLRYQNNLKHQAVQSILTRNRDVKTSIDIRLQLKVSQMLKDTIQDAKELAGAIVVIEPDTGDLLASVSYPWPQEDINVVETDDDNDKQTENIFLDRALYGQYPPGSTFKIVTSITALRKNPRLANKFYECKALGDGRVGNTIPGFGRPIRDDIKDRSPHGAVSLRKGIVTSCNAYFAQLAAFDIGSETLFNVAQEMGISTANSPSELKKSLPQAAYGQGQVLASPFEMARVAATIANEGKMPYGRWVLDDSNKRTQTPISILGSTDASIIAQAMRGVVTEGTAARLKNITIPISGKTGTAEVENKDSHSWFIGFAPYTQQKKEKQIAFAIIIENGGYGAKQAVPIGNTLVVSAQKLNIIQ